MIQLAPTNLRAEILAVLGGLQGQVDSLPTFPEKVESAQSLWKSKGGVAGANAFDEVSATLVTMCVFVGICNYCEQSEANDIEHIYPKSFFPNHTFKWENYILACKQCNSGYKLDKCFVLDNNDDVHEVKRKTEPPYKIGAFINPRIEDPNTFMLLSLTSFKFDLLPGLPLASKNKAEKTIDILNLNERDVLLAARKSAAIYYFQRLKQLVDLLDASTIKEIEELLTPYDNYIDKNANLNAIKEDLKLSFKLHLTKYQHPSVWHSIKVVESKVNEKWKELFDKLPEALNW